MTLLSFYCHINIYSCVCQYPFCVFCKKKNRPGLGRFLVVAFVLNARRAYVYLSGSRFEHCG